MELSVYVAASLDGFIARENGSMDWLRAGGKRPPEEETVYRAFIDSVDAIVMGRVTYDTVREFPSWPYGAKPVVVLSHHDIAIPPALSATVQRMAGPPAELADRFETRGWQHLNVDGGKTIQGFLSAGLISRLIINRVPVLLGSGTPLFGPLPGDLWLEHVRTTSYPGGLVQSELRVKGSGS